MQTARNGIRRAAASIAHTQSETLPLRPGAGETEPSRIARRNGRKATAAHDKASAPTASTNSPRRSRPRRCKRCKGPADFGMAAA